MCGRSRGTASDTQKRGESGDYWLQIITIIIIILLSTETTTTFRNNDITGRQRLPADQLQNQIRHQHLKTWNKTGHQVHHCTCVNVDNLNRERWTGNYKYRSCHICSHTNYVQIKSVIKHKHSEVVIKTVFQAVCYKLVPLPLATGKGAKRRVNKEISGLNIISFTVINHR